MSRDRTLQTVPRLYSPLQLEDATGVPRTTWYTLIARGEIPVVRLGRSVRVRQADLLAYLESRTERAS